MKRALIVCTIGAFLGFELNDIKILYQMGYKIYIATNFKGYEYMKEKLEPFESCNIQTDFTRTPITYSNIKAYKKLKNILAQQRFDLIHCHTPVGGVLARLAAKKYRKLGTKVVYTAHGFHFYTGAPIKNWILFYPIEKLLSRWTDVLITINREDFKRAGKSFHARSVKYVPGVGIDCKLYNKNKEEIKNRKREELGISNEKKVLLSIGELSSRKNHEAVIKSIAKLKDTRVIYCICGTGEKEEKLKKIVRDYKIKEKVKFLGYRNDVDEICNMADIFIFPSIQEGLSVALMEAMASELPICCSNIRGNIDIVDSKGGYLFRPDDIDDIKNKLEIMLECSDDKLLEFGNYNRLKIQNFDKNRVEALMGKIYRKLLVKRCT